MKVVFLAGGYGTRISEESQFKPKPMIEIGGMLILWHIMKEYAHYGYTDFIVCAGYKQHVIKKWFADYFLHTRDITFDFTQGNKMIVHNQHAEPWKMTVVDTGLNTMTGGRIKRVQSYIGNEPFMMTYGDGVCDVNISETQKAIERIREEDTGFLRLAKTFHQIDLKSPVFQGYFGETYYNPMYSEESNNLILTYGLRVPSSNYFYGFEEKRDLRNLFGVKYLISTKSLDYSDYKLLDQTEEVYIYRNRNNVGLSTFYPSLIREQDFNVLDMQMKSEILYQACIVADDEGIRGRWMKANQIENTLKERYDNLKIIRSEDGIDIELEAWK